MKPDIHVIEHPDHNWRLIILEHSLEGWKSVKNIIEADNLADLNEYIDDLERINAPIEELQEPYRSIKLRIDIEAKGQYTKDCLQSWIDLQDREAELRAALEL